MFFTRTSTRMLINSPLFSEYFVMVGTCSSGSPASTHLEGLFVLITLQCIALSRLAVSTAFVCFAGLRACDIRLLYCETLWGSTR